jgi:hypothetical protein
MGHGELRCGRRKIHDDRVKGNRCRAIASKLTTVSVEVRSSSRDELRLCVPVAPSCCRVSLDRIRIELPRDSLLSFRSEPGDDVEQDGGVGDEVGVVSA